MKTIWVKIDPWDKELVTTALEAGADGVMIPDGYSEKVKELGLIETIASDGDLVPGEDVMTIKIESGEDEDEVVRLSQTKKVIVSCTDWTVIPLENLIAKGADVICEVNDLDGAKTAFGILEKGVSQILLDIRDPGELKTTLTELKRMETKLGLSVAEITELRPVGMGDRVCVDTCTSMNKGEGMLVGNSSSALFLVHAETVENPYVSPRPFRVNAGAVHAYTRVPGGGTRYLSELKSGDSVLVVDWEGNATEAVIGRLKIEKRPLMLVKALVNGKDIATIIQNAETIRLTSPDGEAVSIVKLNIGDKVMVMTEEGGRHFGRHIEETIKEK